MTAASEITLKVGKKGEIFTNLEIRKKANIKEGGRVKADVVGNKLIIEAVPSIKDLLQQPPTMKMTTKEFEKLSGEIQRKEKIYG